MQNRFIRFCICTTFIAGIFCTNQTIAQLTSLSENFDVVPPSGWSLINHSTNNGLPWSQGDLRKMSSHSGTKISYAAASYESVGVSGSGTINNWLITPELSLTYGGALTFYTRTTKSSPYADRLEVRLSISGKSNNVGSGTDDTGDFTTLLISINPDVEVGGYPDTGWTKYTIPVAAIPGAITGKIAFRYYVPDGGTQGSNSNYVGIDDVVFESVLPVKMLAFKGSVVNKQAMLSWSTAKEISNKGFEVEMSRDNHTFNSIGFVPATQTKTGIYYYSFADKNLLSGTTYYRLKQIDEDGKSVYSSVVKLDYKNFAWNIIGNSLGNDPFVQLQTLAPSNVTLQVFSMNGKIIQIITKNNLATGAYNIPLNISNTAHGMYIVKLMVNNDVYSKKLMK